MMIAGGFTCQRYGFNVGADKFSLLTIENGKNKHYAPIGMDIDFPKPKISLRQAARTEFFYRLNGKLTGLPNFPAIFVGRIHYRYLLQLPWRLLCGEWFLRADPDKAWNNCPPAGDEILQH